MAKIPELPSLDKKKKIKNIWFNPPQLKYKNIKSTTAPQDNVHSSVL